MGVQIGVLAVRRSILIAAPPERVWREFETLDRMQAWFGTGHELLEYEPHVGGSVLLEVEVEGAMKRFGGKIVAFDPQREVTFESTWIPSEGELAPSLLTLRLTPALGGTVVELFHHALEREGGDYADRLQGLEGGWTTRQLGALRAIVEG